MMPDKPKATFDVECLMNYFLVTVMHYPSTKVIAEFEMYNNSKLDVDGLTSVFNNHTMYSFNGNRYDMLIISAALAGANNIELKSVSDDVIGNRLMPWAFERKYNCKIIDCDHVDLIEVAFGSASLKVYGGRLQSKRLMEMPLHHNSYMLPHDTRTMRTYCVNDNLVTCDLLKDCELALELRERLSADYGLDLMSKSDAQIGEAIFKKSTFDLSGKTIKKPDSARLPREYRYDKPDFVEFKFTKCQKLLELCMVTRFVLSKDKKLVNPEEFKGFSLRWCHDYDLDARLVARLEEIKSKRKKVYLDERRELTAKMQANIIKEYTFGIGGLHSIDDRGYHEAVDDSEIFEIDVSSYYPNIIMNANYYVPSMGLEIFQKIYRGLIDIKNDSTARVNELKSERERVSKLQNSDVNSSLLNSINSEIDQLTATIKGVKIVINGVYGKFGSPYSPMFAPGLLLGTTLTGQLCLLMLLEQFHHHGIEVLSANTDGINVHTKNKDEKRLVDSIVKDWMDKTGFVMDYNYYKNISYRDVNNYFYTKESSDGSLKCKGIGYFASDGIRKSPEDSIIRDALFDLMCNGTQIEDHIEGCDDIHKFMTLKKCTSGAFKDGYSLGKTIRWYRSISTTSAILAANGNKVAGSDNAMPLMDIPDDTTAVLADVDRAYYIDKTYEIMDLIGIPY